MVDYVEAIKKPFSDLKTLAIGTILSAIPLVNLLASGFALKVAEDTIKGKKALRSFAVDDIVEYIIKVIMAFVISLVYMIIPTIILGIGIGAGVTALIGGMTDPNAAGEAIAATLALGGPFILIGVLLMIIASFLLPMAMMKWLKAGKIGAAFKVGEVVKSALTLKYIITLVVIVIYAAIVGTIAGILSTLLAITVILPILIMGLVSFIMSVTTMTMCAEASK